MPIRHTRVSPSREFTSILNELQIIAALAKVLGLSTLYCQAKEIHDNMVCQYRIQTAPKKKGFWEQFKDNLLFRDLDTYTAEHIDLLEEDPFFDIQCKLCTEVPRYELQKTLQSSLDKINQRYR